MTERLPTDADLLDYDYLETCLRAEIAIYGRMSGETSFDPIDFYLGLMKQARETALGHQAAQGTQYDLVVTRHDEGAL